MNVQQLMNVAAERQDWNEEVQLIHALGFIDSLVVAGTIGSADLADYLDAVEREENAEMPDSVRNAPTGARTVYAVVTCLPEPGEARPCIPELFTTKAEAEACADAHLRAEWDANGPEDADGEREPYPGDWREADRIMAAANPEWGRWELTTHSI